VADGLLGWSWPGDSGASGLVEMVEDWLADGASELGWTLGLVASCMLELAPWVGTCVWWMELKSML